MRFARVFLIFAVIVAIAALAWSSGVKAGVDRNSIASSGQQSSFDLRTTLSHDDQSFTVELFNGQPFAMTVLEMTLTRREAGSLATYTTYEAVTLDSFGTFTATVPLSYSANATNFEILWNAYTFDTQGQVIAAATPHRYGNLDVEEFDAIQSISPIAWDDLSGLAPGTSDEYATRLGMATSSVLNQSPGPSWAFSSQSLDANGDSITSGRGNYHATAPAVMFSLTSGPSGIFTAN